MVKSGVLKEMFTNNLCGCLDAFRRYISFKCRKVHKLFFNSYYETETLTELKKRRLPPYPHLGNGKMYIVRLAALPWYQELPSLMLLTS